MIIKASIFDPTKNSKSEDALLTTPKLHCVADGAGGTGILCGEWAKYLCNKVPEKHIKDFTQFIEWFQSIADDFVDSHEQLVSNDPFQLRRYYQEGSASTLAITWIVGNTIKWLTYGDSHVFYYHKGVLESFPFKTRDELSGSTYLLNWMQSPDQLGFKSGSFSYKKDAKYLLATDEVAKHIFYLYENFHNNFDKKLQILEQSMNSELTFENYIKTQPDIGQDDYSLIIFDKSPIS